MDATAILLVDDDEDTRVLFGQVLARRGFTVEAVESAHACLGRLASAPVAPVAVVVTDVEMPGMTGIELCAALRAQYPGVVSVVVSGRADSTIEAAALASGAFRVLHKPVSSVALAGVLEQALALRIGTSR